MRIIAGQFGGRLFDSPKTNKTHPMSEKVRGALLNVLADVSELRILDAYAGSGALGLEALSRGASHATFIESDRSAQETIAGNIKQLGVTNRAKLIRASVSAWLTTTNDTFDIVLCDPPYNAVQAGLIAQLSERVRPNGWLVLSLPPSQAVTLPDYLTLGTSKDYGDATLSFYRRLR